MNALLIIMLVLLAVSGVGLIAFIMLHSGKGTGISEMIQSSIEGSMGTNIVEKNLDRFTIICAVVFLLVLIILMVIYPHGTIA